jgi:hypothetical protein
MLFATPIAYPSSLLPEPWRTIYGLNPMVGVVEGFRWALLGTNTAPGPIIAVSSTAAIIILVTGAFYFRRMEKSFADIVRSGSAKCKEQRTKGEGQRAEKMGKESAAKHKGQSAESYAWPFAASPIALGVFVVGIVK